MANSRNSRQCDNPDAEHPGFPCNHTGQSGLSDPAPRPRPHPRAAVSARQLADLMTTTLPTFVHQEFCRANTYHDNDVCNCDPIELPVLHRLWGFGNLVFRDSVDIEHVGFVGTAVSITVWDTPGTMASFQLDPDTPVLVERVDSHLTGPYDDPTGGIGADDLPRVPESEDPWAMLEHEAAEAATPQPEPRPLDFDSPVTIELHLVTGEILATTIPPTWYSARSDLFYTNLDLLVWAAMADGIPATEVRIVPAAGPVLPATDTGTPENGNPS